MIKLSEFFYSLKGEGAYLGTPMLFVRFAECNLSCPGCDTPRDIGYDVSWSRLLEVIKNHPCKRVVLTGGEPLIQEDVDYIMEELWRCEKIIHIESNGTICPTIIKENQHNQDLWIACSPKPWGMSYLSNIDKNYPLLMYADEVKLPVTPNYLTELSHFLTKEGHIRWQRAKKQLVYLQPWNDQQFINRGNLLRAIQLCKEFPHLNLSIQAHKYLRIK